MFGRQSSLFLAAWEASCHHPFAERHFSSVLWPLARDVQRITYTALALDIHIL